MLTDLGTGRYEDCYYYHNDEIYRSRFVQEVKTEEDLWDIFQKTINSIDENCEIILDITHSLRNIPIQILVALNCLKLFKNIKLSGIY